MPPKVTKEKVMVSVDIEEKGAASIARYSGLFFVFAGAMLSLFALGGIYAETETYVAKSKYESEERFFSYLVARDMRAQVATFADPEPVTDEEASEEVMLAMDAALPTEAEEGTVAEDSLTQAVPAESSVPAYLQAAAVWNGQSVPEVFSQNAVALISSLVVAMLGLSLLLISMYISSRRRITASPLAATEQKIAPPPPPPPITPTPSAA